MPTLEVLVDTFLPHSAGPELLDGEETGKHVWEKTKYVKGSLVDSDDLAPDFVELVESGERSVRASVRFVKAKPDEEPRQGHGSKPADVKVDVELNNPQSHAEGTSSLPKGYAELTVEHLKIAAKTWEAPQLEAALVYERSHDDRKTAMAVLEEYLAAKGGE